MRFPRFMVHAGSLHVNAQNCERFRHSVGILQNVLQNPAVEAPTEGEEPGDAAADVTVPGGGGCRFRLRLMCATAVETIQRSTLRCSAKNHRRNTARATWTFPASSNRMGLPVRLWLRWRIFFSVSTGDFGRSLRCGPLRT